MGSSGWGRVKPEADDGLDDPKGGFTLPNNLSKTITACLLFISAIIKNSYFTQVR
jgi:hypothetical protein